MMRPMKKDPMAMMMNLGGMLRKKKEEGMAYGDHGMMVPGEEKVKIVMKMPGGGIVKNPMRDSMMMGDGGIMKYRAGGEMPMYQEGGPVVIEDTSDLLSALNTVDVPEDYTEQEFIDVRGTAKMGDQEVMKAAGGAFDRDVAQPLEFYVRKYGGEGGARSNVRFELEDIELGGVDEETGELIPNTITLPAEIFDMVEDGTIARKDMIQALGQSYSRSDERGRRAVPQIIRGEDPEPRDPGEPGPPGRGKIKKKRKVNIPGFRFAPRSVPRYGGGFGTKGPRMRPLFKRGQLGRIGRGA